MADATDQSGQYRAIVNTAIDGIVVIDEHGIVQSFNPAAERMFQYSAAEVIGRNVSMITPSPHREAHDQYLENYRRTGVAKIIGIGREVQGLRKDGSLIPVDLAIAEWFAGGRRYFTGIMRDLSERKLAEEELRRLNEDLERRVRDEVAQRQEAQQRAAQAERMQALGQLAGGIAHDFNNLLQAVTGSAEILAKRAGQPDSVQRLANTILAAAERGTSVTERLLAFARRSSLKAEALDVAKTLNDLGRMLTQTLGGSVSLRVEIEAGMPPLMADKGQLATVLINLATNARDAMPEGGVIAFAAARSQISADNRLGLQPGRYIRLGVSDTGRGMDAETLARATEPFFTTKTEGRGTGLGLSMAKGFAEQSGGALKIESKPGAGTTVSVYLPEAEILFGSAEHADEAASHPRILLVDDDVLVRETLTMALEDAGYRVISAGGGNEAVSLFMTGGADLLLTDLSMPGMNGVSLIMTLQERAPGLPAILITGYATEHAQIGETTSFTLLRKPISAARLYEVIAGCLQGRHPVPA